MSAQALPVVSIITATRNRPQLLKMALQSIADQTLRDFEAIVVDDGSDAATLDCYESIWAGLDHRFKLIPPSAPGAFGTGPADTRNRGIQQARGEFLAFLDDDDQWIAADHLEVGINALRQLDGDLYFANLQGSRAGKITRPDWFAYAPYLKTTPRLSGPAAIYEVSRENVTKTLKQDGPHLDVVILRRDLVQQFGGFIKHGWAFEDLRFVYHAADRARRMLYRADVVANYRYPEGDSITLTHTSQSLLLQHLACVQGVRLSCQTPTIRKTARVMEAWVYRQLAQDSAAKRQGREAVALAWQGLCTYPSLGSVATLTKILGYKLGLVAPSPKVADSIVEKPMRPPGISSGTERE
jgi:hypothetical protein